MCHTHASGAPCHMFCLAQFVRLLGLYLRLMQGPTSKSCAVPVKHAVPPPAAAAPRELYCSYISRGRTGSSPSGRLHRPHKVLSPCFLLWILPTHPLQAKLVHRFVLLYTL